MMRPRARPEGMMKKKKKKTAAPEKSIRPRARPEMIGNTPDSQGTRGIDPKENYSPEDFKRLTGGMKAGGMMKKKGYAKGGMMKKGYKKGGKIRGCGIARKGVRAAKMV